MEVEAEKVDRAYKQFNHKLTAREDDVITRFYGINKHVRHTLAEIAEMYQVTRERIRQIKSEALKKLRFKPKD